MKEQNQSNREIIAPDTRDYAGLTEQRSLTQRALAVLEHHPGAVDLAALGAVYGLANLQHLQVPGWAPYVCVVLVLAASLIRRAISQ